MAYRTPWGLFAAGDECPHCGGELTIGDWGGTFERGYQDTVLALVCLDDECDFDPQAHNNATLEEWRL